MYTIIKSIYMHQVSRLRDIRVYRLFYDVEDIFYYTLLFRYINDHRKSRSVPYI